MECVIPNTNNFYHARGIIRKIIDWPLLCIEQHSDNVRKITLQLILNALSDYEQWPGIAAL